IASGYFSKGDREIFKPIIGSLLYAGDRYLLTLDYDSYIACQKEVSKEFTNQEKWVEKSIINSANMGKFSSDRTILEYANEIWHVDSITELIKEHKKNKIIK
ncbi:glycogen/starch/alpha-glucan phosphorylase, partial [bacterium]|nr:glycogen/starch/alpha-glucan phosphorylase [bacterium]